MISIGLSRRTVLWTRWRLGTVIPCCQEGNPLPSSRANPVERSDANVTDCGFHDVTLVDMANADRPVVPVGDLCLSRASTIVSSVTSYYGTATSHDCPGAAASLDPLRWAATYIAGIDTVSAIR